MRESLTVPQTKLIRPRLSNGLEERASFVESSVSSRQKVFELTTRPFLGVAALYSFNLFRLAFLLSKSSLSDTNPELINAYRTVKDHVEELILLLLLKKRSDTFFRLRNIINEVRDHQDPP